MRRSPRPRSRLWYLITAAVVIALGLASRAFADYLPAVLGKYPGDALWTILVFCLWAVVMPRARPGTLLAAALVTSAAVELSQSSTVPWLVAVRTTRLGHLVLGSTFNAPDLVAYLCGALVAWCGEHAVHSHRTSPRSRSLRDTDGR